jgi:hypothetical protein
MSKREKVVRAWANELNDGSFITAPTRQAAKNVARIWGNPVVRVEIRVVQPKARKKARKS